MVKINAVAFTVSSTIAAVSADQSCPKFSGSLVATAIPDLKLSDNSSVGQCLGSIDVNDLTSTAGGKLTSILSDKNGPCDMDKISTIAGQLVGLVSGGNTDKPDLIGLLTAAASDADTACDDAGAIVKCVTDKDILSGVFELIQSKSDCCGALEKGLRDALVPEDKRSDNMGTDLKSTITRVVYDLDNALCSTYTSGDSQKCLAAMEPAFFSEPSNMINLLKIPNDKAYDAYEGKEFENVDNSSVTFPKAYSGCAGPLDTIITNLKDMPITKPLNDMFESGKCMDGDDAQKAMSQVPLIGSSLSPVFSKGCYHLANGFSKDAKWTEEVKLVHTSSGSDPSKDDNQSSSTGAGALTSVSAAAIAVAVAQFFM